MSEPVWLPIDDPEQTQAWIGGATLDDLRIELGKVQLFIAQRKLHGQECDEDLGHARRIVRQIRVELIRRGLLNFLGAGGIKREER